MHEADDGLIIFDPENDKVHHLNASAGVLFSLCDSSQKRHALVASFMDAYSLDENTQSDVEASIDKLVSEGVLLSTQSD